MIWFRDYTIDFMNEKAAQENILNRLGIRFTEVGPDYLTATMPVDARTHQPYGILHGGATCVLAESLGSFASIMRIDPDKNFAVGSVITTNHLRPVSSGIITGTCRPVHLGRTKHVWDIHITDERGRLIAKSELTCAVTPAQSGE
jgi:1,4-dihydroxy-2-naphthoyl-CoA hydrolase